MRSCLTQAGRLRAEPKLTFRAAQNLQRAKELAKADGAVQVEERHLLAAILGDDAESFTLRALRDLGVDVAALRSGGAGAGTPILDRVGRDLTALARKGELDPLIGRHEQVRQLVRTLARKKKNNPVLIGLAGVGKTAIVEGLAALIAAGQIPIELRECRLVELPMAALVAGTTYRGQFEERLLGLINEVKAAGNIILFIDEIHTILRAGAVEDSLDAGNILKPALARGDLRVIGATTPEEYQRYILQDAALERRFQPVWVPEPRPEDALEMLRGVKACYEAHHGVVIADEALDAAVKLSVAWLPDRHLPDKALDLLDEACARARIPTISKPTDRIAGLVVTARTVAEVVGEWQGISADVLLDAE